MVRVSYRMLCNKYLSNTQKATKNIFKTVHVITVVQP